MCGASSSGEVHFRGARRVGATGAAGVRATLGLTVLGALAGLGAAGCGGGGAGIPWTHVDSGRSHRSQ